MRKATKRSEARIWQKKNLVTKEQLLAEISRVDRTFKTGAAHVEQIEYGNRLRAQLAALGA